MATQVINTTFQFKRGLANAWERANPILAPGEPGWTLDTHILKVGDGITPWNELSVITGTLVDEAEIKAAVEEYLQKHPISVKTDATLSVAGQAADAAAVRANCLFSTDCLILSAGDADDNIFS